MPLENKIKSNFMRTFLNGFVRCWRLKKDRNIMPDFECYKDWKILTTSKQIYKEICEGFGALLQNSTWDNLQQIWEIHFTRFTIAKQDQIRKFH